MNARWLPWIFAVGLAFAQPEKVVPLFEAAKTAERANQPEKALEYYGQILRIDPGIAEVWANQGLLLHGLNRPREAVKALAQAVRLKPGLARAQLYLGMEYLALSEPKLALPPLRMAARLEPGNPEAAFQLAHARLETGDYVPAVQALQALLERDPKSELSWYELGMAYTDWGRSAARLLVNGPSPYGRLLMAELRAAKGMESIPQEQYKAALAGLAPALASEIPLDPETLQIRKPGPQKDALVHAWKDEPAGGQISAAVAAWNRGEYNRSVNLLEKLLRVIPDNGRALYWLVMNSRILSRECFVRAVESNPGSSRAHLLLADVAAQQKDQATALDEYAQAVAAAPENPEPRLAQVRYLAALGRSEEAAAKAREGVQRFPGHAGLSCELGNLLLADGHAGEAAGLLRKALDADPGMMPARVALADACAAVGQPEKAIEEMKKALSSDRDGGLHYRIARWYRETGHPEEARLALAETARLKARKMEADQVLFSTSRR